MRTLRRLAAPSAVSLTSQALGFLQTLLLVRGFGATSATDAYFFLYGLGLMPSLILLEGYWYPSLLRAAGRTDRIGAARRERWVTAALPISIVLLVGSGAIWLQLQRGGASGGLTIPILIAVNAVVNALTWKVVVQRSAEGDPTPWAGLMLPANACACLALLVPADGSPARTMHMLAALIAGNAAFLVLLRASESRTQRPVESPPAEPSPETDLDRAVTSSAAGNGWYLAKAATGAGTGNVIQAYAAVLPAGALSTLAIVSRVVGSGTTSFINALLPKFVHAHSASLQEAERFARVVFGSATVAIAGATLVWLVSPGTVTLYVALAATWVLAAAMSAIAQRLGIRVLSPRAASSVVMATCVAIVAALAITSSRGLSLPALLVGLIALDGIPAVVLLRRVGLRSLALATLLVELTALAATAAGPGWS